MAGLTLGIDPGTRKCGYAVVRACGEPPIAIGIILIDDLDRELARLAGGYAIETVALGRGTNAAFVGAALDRVALPYTLVDERETTLRARARFFVDHPPRGWRRLIPRGMLLPDRPIDDYAALLIAERYIKKDDGPLGDFSKSR